MPKSDIHPDYHEVTIKFPTGATLKTASTYGKPGSIIAIDINIHDHQAWQDDSTKARSADDSINENIKKFQQRMKRSS